MINWQREMLLTFRGPELLWRGVAGAAVLAAIAGGGMALWQQHGVTEEIRSLNAGVGQLHVRHQAHDDAIEQIQEQLGGRITAVGGHTRQVEGSVKQVEGEVGTVRGQVSAVREHTGQLEAATGRIGTHVQQVEGGVRTLQEQHQTLASNTTRSLDHLLLVTSELAAQIQDLRTENLRLSNITAKIADDLATIRNDTVVLRRDITLELQQVRQFR